MRAAFFEARGRIIVREVPAPEPALGEVRLAVRFCGICGSDLSLFKTGALAGPETVLGHEISAVVDMDPSGEWTRGSRVVPFPSRGCGNCTWCREGHWRYCLDPPQGLWGGFAEFVVYPKRNLIPIPDGLDDRVAAAAEPLGVALRALELSGARPSDLVYVSGLGAIGLFMVASLASAGCRVVGADPNEERRGMAMDQGCEVVFDPTLEDPTSTMLEFDPHGPALAFECAGAPDSLQQVLDACGHQGTVGILGVPMAPVLLLRMTIKEQRAFAIAGPSWDSMSEALQHLLEQPRMGKVVAESVPLDGLGEAIEGLIRGHGGPKVLVDPRG